MKWFRRAARWALFLVVFAVCAAMFYLIAVMGNGSEALPRVTLSPAAAMQDGALAFSAQELDTARAYSSAPLATLSSGWYLTGCEVRQWSERGETMREVRLSYTQNNGTQQVSLSTVTPREYLYTLPDRGLVVSAAQDCLMLSRQATLMSDGATAHLHVASGEAVYQLEGTLSVDELRTAAGFVVLPE